MARRQAAAQPPVRKSFLIFGGVALAAALLGFVLLNFVFGGDDGAEIAAPEPTNATTGGGSSPAVATTPPTETPQPRRGLRPGGRDPFRQGDAPPAAAPAPASTPEPTAAPDEEQSNDPVTVAVLDVYGEGADIQIDDEIHEGVRPGDQIDPRFALDDIEGECAFMTEYGERFRVCEGTRVRR